MTDINEENLTHPRHRGRMEGPAHAGAIQGRPPEGDRAGVHRRVLGQQGRRQLSLRVLRRARCFPPRRSTNRGRAGRSFFQPLSNKAVATASDGSLFTSRTEILCSACGRTSGTSSKTARSRRAALLHQLGLAEVRAGNPGGTPEDGRSLTGVRFVFPEISILIMILAALGAPPLKCGAARLALLSAVQAWDAVR